MCASIRLPLLDITQFLKNLLHVLHVPVLVGSTNIDPVQRKGMGIKEAHLVASALISSFQCMTKSTIFTIKGAEYSVREICKR